METDRDLTDVARDYMTGIERNYPDWPSTFGPCSTKGCKNHGRGCGPCAPCYENKLSEVVGTYLAQRFHQAIKERVMVKKSIIEQLEGNE